MRAFASGAQRTANYAACLRSASEPDICTKLSPYEHIVCLRLTEERFKAFLRQYPDTSLPTHLQQPHYAQRLRTLRAAFRASCPPFTSLVLSHNQVRSVAMKGPLSQHALHSWSLHSFELLARAEP